MNIPIPKGMKSPTVIIVGGKEPDDKHNQMAMSRMDNLERKLDQQYKTIIDKTDYVKVIDKLQNSFMSNFNKILEMNKSMISQSNQERFNSLREELKRKIKTLEEDKGNEENLRFFTSKLNSLENAIKGITLKPQIVRVNNGNNKGLEASLENMFQRMESVIRQSRPRLTPSPS